MALLANRQPKTKVKPASGTCRWIVTIGDADTGVLAINGTNYTVTVLRGPNRVDGYRLVKTDGTTDDIAPRKSAGRVIARMQLSIRNGPAVANTSRRCGRP
jgi:hypothetical protein